MEKKYFGFIVPHNFKRNKYFAFISFLLLSTSAEGGAIPFSFKGAKGNKSLSSGFPSSTSPTPFPVSSPFKTTSSEEIVNKESDLYVGYNGQESEKVILTGLTKNLFCNEILHVGFEGKGILAVQAGGTITADVISIGTEPDSYGLLSIGSPSPDPTKAVHAGKLNVDSINFGQGKGEMNFNYSGKPYPFPSRISGKGRINISSGEPIFTGTSPYSGQITISHKGVLQIGDGGVKGRIGGSIINDSKLIFNRRDNITYKNIQGKGSLIKKGEGELSLEGVNTYTGATKIKEGTVNIKNTLKDSSIIVKEKGTLKASGIIKSLFSNGTTMLDPKGDKLLIKEDIRLGNGHTLKCKINQLGQPASILAKGEISLGGILEVDIDNIDLFAPQTYVILSSDKFISNQFSTIKVNSEDLMYEVLYGQKELLLSIKPKNILSAPPAPSIAQAPFSSHDGMEETSSSPISEREVAQNFLSSAQEEMQETPPSPMNQSPSLEMANVDPGQQLLSSSASAEAEETPPSPSSEREVISPQVEGVNPTSGQEALLSPPRPAEATPPSPISERGEISPQVETVITEPDEEIQPPIFQREVAQNLPLPPQDAAEEIPSSPINQSSSLLMANAVPGQQLLSSPASAEAEETPPSPRSGREVISPQVEGVNPTSGQEALPSPQRPAEETPPSPSSEREEISPQIETVNVEPDQEAQSPTLQMEVAQNLSLPVQVAAEETPPSPISGREVISPQVETVNVEPDQEAQSPTLQMEVAQNLPLPVQVAVEEAPPSPISEREVISQQVETVNVEPDQEVQPPTLQREVAQNLSLPVQVAAEETPPSPISEREVISQQVETVNVEPDQEAQSPTLQREVAQNLPLPVQVAAEETPTSPSSEREEISPQIETVNVEPDQVTLSASQGIPDETPDSSVSKKEEIFPPVDVLEKVFVGKEAGPFLKEEKQNIPEFVQTELLEPNKDSIPYSSVADLEEVKPSQKTFNIPIDEALAAAEMNYTSHIFLPHLPSQLKANNSFLSDAFIQRSHAISGSINNEMIKIFRETSNKFSLNALPGTNPIQLPHSSRSQLEKIGFWVQSDIKTFSHKKLAHYTGNNDSLGVLAHTYTTNLGGDYKLNEDLMLGLMVGYSSTHYKFDKTPGEGKINSYRLGIYSGWKPKETWYVNMFIGYGYHRLTEQTKFPLQGYNHNGNRLFPHFNSSIEIGYDFKLTEEYFLTPYSEISCFYLYSQKNKKQRTFSNNSLFIHNKLGAKFSKIWKVNNMRAYSFIKLGYYRRESLYRNHPNINMVDHTGVYNLQLDRNPREFFSYKIGGAILLNNMDIGIAYERDASNTQKSHQGFVQIVWKF